MKLIGITGGIGMGKSTAVQFLRSWGISVIETDVQARDLVEPGQPALLEIQRVFGPEVIGPDGRLLRRELGARVFADAQARQVLESILHPRIRAAWETQTARWRKQGCACAAVDIPLLYETKAESHFNLTICVACQPASQHQRLLERGWTELEIEQRVKAQLPIDQKMARANYVVWTESSLEVHAEQLRHILHQEEVKIPRSAGRKH